MKIISHRGLWNNSIGKNTKEAFTMSFDEKLGIETDLRDFEGKLVISHDIANKETMAAEELFKLYDGYNDNQLLALNVKADGIQDLISEYIHKYEIKNYFLFDMSIPEQYVYINKGLKVFARQSDIEKYTVLYDRVDGIWLDSFEEEWIDEETIKYHLDNKKIVCIVSPELHGREYKERWNIYKNIDKKYDNNQLVICTDYPIIARSFFNGK